MCIILNWVTTKYPRVKADAPWAFRMNYLPSKCLPVSWHCSICLSVCLPIYPSIHPSSLPHNCLSSLSLIVFSGKPPESWYWKYFYLMKIRYICLDKQSSTCSLPTPGGLRFPQGYTGTDGLRESISSSSTFVCSPCLRTLLWVFLSSLPFCMLFFHWMKLRLISLLSRLLLWCFISGYENLESQVMGQFKILMWCWKVNV